MSFQTFLSSMEHKSRYSYQKCQGAPVLFWTPNQLKDYSNYWNNMITECYVYDSNSWVHYLSFGHHATHCRPLQVKEWTQGEQVWWAAVDLRISSHLWWRFWKRQDSISVVFAQHQETNRGVTTALKTPNLVLHPARWLWRQLSPQVTLFSKLCVSSLPSFHFQAF